MGGGCRSIAPLVLNFGTIWRREANFTLLPLYPRETLNTRLGGPQRQVGRCGGNFSLCNLVCTPSVVTMPSEWGISAKELVVAEWRRFVRV